MTAKKILIVQTGSLAERKPEFLEHCGDFDACFIKMGGFSSDETKTVRVFEGDALPETLHDIAGVLVTGSSHMVSGMTPWMITTAAWLRNAVAAGLPTLGVCFGHQLLAVALGGTVDVNPKGIEAGAIDIHLTVAGKIDPLFQDFPLPMKFLSHHVESVTRLPADATLLAFNDHDLYQAVRYRPLAWGVQFHPELTADLLRTVVDQEKSALERQGIDVHRLLNAIDDCPAGKEILRRFRSLTRSAPGSAGLEFSVLEAYYRTPIP